jgi:hypothetical protein
VGESQSWNNLPDVPFAAHELVSSWAEVSFATSEMVGEFAHPTDISTARTRLLNCDLI